MSFFERALQLFGPSPARRAAARADLERLADEELQARISRGRPAPEEWRRTRPRPRWAMPRPISSRPLDLVEVRLDPRAGGRGPNPAADPAPAGRRRRAVRSSALDR